jgi:hypothetical protein
MLTCSMAPTTSTSCLRRKRGCCSAISINISRASCRQGGVGAYKQVGGWWRAGGGHCWVSVGHTHHQARHVAARRAVACQQC